MARNQNKAVRLDPYENEYGPMQKVYLDDDAYQRLNGGGSWFTPFKYADSPTEQYCYKIIVPESSLEKGFFHPDRFEPDIAAERCVRVSPEEIARENKDKGHKSKGK